MLSGFPLLLVLLLAIVLIIIGTARFKIHPFLVLVSVTLLLGFAVGMPGNTIIQTMTTGFGSLVTNIGLVIVLGTLLGVALEESGAAMTLASLVIRLAGEKRLVSAMGLVGAIVGIPVFCDTAFIILSNLNKSLAVKLNQSVSGLSISLASGLYATHVLVPPTPGPLAAAGNLGAGNYLGYIMILGLLVAIPTTLAGAFWARYIGRKVYVPVEDAVLQNQEALTNGPVVSGGAALAPLLLPVLLIAMQAIATVAGYKADWLQFAGNPNVALLAGVLLAMCCLPGTAPQKLNGWTAKALIQAGPILLITAAGGALGALLKATPLQDLFSGFFESQQLSGSSLVLIVFLLAAALKSSQGSSTAALVITSSLVGAVLPATDIDNPWQLAVLVLTIGGGAMTVSHANDSYFWVVSQFSGMSVAQTYRTLTVATLIQGITVLLCCLLLFAVVG